MVGVARFLLGVALGVVLGFLISRNRSQKIPKGAEPLSSAGEAPAATSWAASVAPWAPAVEAEAPEEAPFAVVEEPAVEEAPVAPEPEPPSVESPEFAAAMAEAATESEVAMTPEALEELLPGVGWEPSAELAGSFAADDLKARIEETRRRIRMELEQPFVDVNGEATVEDGVEAEEVAMEPAPEPVIGEALMEPASELGVDYDAMRGRIETTRDRLKAKAFDAMMTGESALLGRDSAHAAGELPALADVDSEIVQTIETTLREEEG